MSFQVQLRRLFEPGQAVPDRIKTMEGIRGIAVALVFFVHYGSLIEPWLRESSAAATLARILEDVGNIGVDLFFVLSGFLIYGMLISKPTSFRTYFLKRIRRIYPTFLVVMGLYLVLSFVFPAESKLPHESAAAFWLILENLLLLPGLFDVPAIITVAWSLSYEMACYLAIPLMITLLQLRQWPRVLRMGLFLGISALGFYYFSGHSGHMRVLMFLSGILLFETLDGGYLRRLPPIGVPALVCAVAVVVLLSEWHADLWLRYLALYLLFFVFCLEVFVSTGMSAWLFSRPFVRWLGNMSYSYYLIHGLALKFLFLVLIWVHPARHADSDLFWWMLLPAFLLTLIPAAALYLLVERPVSLVPASASSGAVAPAA